MRAKFLAGGKIRALTIMPTNNVGALTGLTLVLSGVLIASIVAFIFIGLLVAAFFLFFLLI
jgi:hypothetical protein